MSAATPLEVLKQAEAAGLRLSAEADRLIVEADVPEVLTDEWRDRLREHKHQLLALLSGPPPLSSEDREAIAEAIEERAAIREFDGGETREEAEHQALSAMRVYRVLVAMRDGRPKWVTMIAPGCNLVEARRDACLQFGAERVLGIEVNHPARGKQWAGVQCSESDD